MNCPRCGELMIDSSIYDPDGTLKLEQIEEDGRYWVCINRFCNVGHRSLPDEKLDNKIGAKVDY